MTAATNWYGEALCKLHFDMHTPEDVEHVGRDFDPDAFAAAAAATGAEAVCFFSRCAYGWSYYPTGVGRPHPHLSRDLFGEGLAAMKRAGLRAIAYYAIDNVPAPLAEAHPDWVCRLPDGAPRQGHGTAFSACLRGPYADQSLIAQVCEIAERYEVDGFFFDGVYQFFHHTCYCDGCREAYGSPLPQEADDPGWRAFRHWQVGYVWDAMNRAAEALGRARKGCLLGVNWLASARWSVPPPPAVGYLTGDPPLRNCTFETAYHLASWSWRDVPADVMTERMLHHWQDFTCRTPETIETELDTAIACGGTLFVGDLLRPVEVRPDPEVMRLHRRTFAHADLRRRLGEGTAPRAEVAIVSSPETMRGRGATWHLDETPVRGAYLALLEDGLTAHILFDDDLVGRLGNYRCLVVPEQAYLGRAAAEAIQSFVHDGGGLAVVGRLPQAVEPTEPDEAADAGIFEALTGLRSEGVQPFDPAYLCLRGTAAEDWWRAGDDFRPPVPVPGPTARLRADVATVLALVTAPGPTYQIGAKPPGEATDSPALAVHGKVVTCALPLTSDIWKRGNPGAKYVLHRMVREALGTPTVERRGTPAVQLTWAEGSGRTVLHLVAYQPDRRTDTPQVIESPPLVPGVTVRLLDTTTPRAITLEPGGTPLAAVRRGEHLEVAVPPFATHTAVVFTW